MVRLLSEKYKWLSTSPRNQRKFKSTSLFCFVFVVVVIHIKPSQLRDSLLRRLIVPATAYQVFQLFLLWPYYFSYIISDYRTRNSWELFA